MLAISKELSILPIFKNMNIGENLLSVFLSKLFDDTLLAKHDNNGRIIKEPVLKFDLHAELGAGIELGRQAIPVVARTFYFIRRLVTEMRWNVIKSIPKMNQINWVNVKLLCNATIARMLTISTGVLTTVDTSEAI